METFITIVIILLMLIFNKPLFALAGGGWRLSLGVSCWFSYSSS